MHDPSCGCTSANRIRMFHRTAHDPGEWIRSEPYMVHRAAALRWTACACSTGLHMIRRERRHRYFEIHMRCIKRSWRALDILLGTVFKRPAGSAPRHHCLVSAIYIMRKLHSAETISKGCKVLRTRHPASPGLPRSTTICTAQFHAELDWLSGVCSQRGHPWV